MLSKQIAAYTTALQFADLPQEVVDAARMAVLDWLGSVLAGSQEPPAGMVAAVARRAGGNPEATMIGFSEKTSSLQAALVNGVSCHILELDDLHRSSILHPAAPVIAAAFAAAESRRAGGKELLTAVTAGYEIAIRIAEAVTPSHYHYWHTTATCGTFGAAIAAAKIFGLGADQIIHALGSAGSQAAGLWEFLKDGAMTKHLHPGKAATNGLLAALLAAEGFTGASLILEGEKGFFRATAPEFFPERATAALGEEYRILGNSYKIYPSCRHTHSGVDLALKLVAGGLDPLNIEKVVFKTYRHACDLVGGSDFTTPFKAKFSLPYCAARAFFDGKLDLDSFDFSVPPAAPVAGLAKRCLVVIDPELEKQYPQCWGAAIEVTLKDGRLITERTDYPRGDPENPAGELEMANKFRQLAGRRFGPEHTELILDRLRGLEFLNNVAELL